MNTHKLDARIVGRSFRSAVLSAFPAAEGNPSHMRLLLYLLLSPWQEPDGERRTVLTYKQLAACAGTSHTHRNFNASAFLTEFEAHVMPLNLTDHSHVQGKARTALPQWPVNVLNALQVELNMCRVERLKDAVYFVSGKPFSTRKRKEKAMQRHDIESLLQPDHPALDLLEFANSQQSTFFNKLINRNVDKAREVAKSIQKFDKEGQLLEEATDAAQLHALRILHVLDSAALHADAMPRYKPSKNGNTARIFSDGQSFLGLPKAVRRALMPDCPELDLGNAQLAIAAKEWNIPEVEEYLSTGKKIWPGLEQHLGLEPDTYKPVLKKALYALLFGMQKGAVTRLLAYGEQDVMGIGSARAKGFFDHSLIKALYAAREKALGALLEAGQAVTCFDKVMKVTDRDSARSALAAQMQSIELSLLLPAVELLKANGDLTLVAWQHDGFTVHSSNSSKTERYVKQLQKAVDSKASTCGYMTRLERSA